MERFVKIVLLLTALVVSTGCSTLNIPRYIQDKFPYKQNYYSSFEKTLAATKKTLRKFGWEKMKTEDPAVFEHERTFQLGGVKQVLIFTQEKKSSRILFSRYTHLNVYLRSIRQGTEVEVRYVSYLSLPFKSFTSYKNDRYVKKLFDSISVLLEQ